GDRLRPGARPRALHGQRGRGGGGDAPGLRAARRVRRRVTRPPVAREGPSPRRRGGGAARRSGSGDAGRRRRRAAPLRLHFASAELAPLALSGGLGEAVAGLARALAARGHEVTCLLPGHRRALESPALPPLADAGPVSLSVPDGEGDLVGRWLEGRLGALRLLLLDLPALYDRPRLYGGSGEEDDALRFTAFARAVAARAAEIGTAHV